MRKKYQYNTSLLDTQYGEKTPIELKYSKESFGVDQWIDIDKIRIDFEVQRELQPSHSEKIAANFDPRSFGRITVTQREDGFYYCTNGMHRLEALKLLEFKEAPCTVIKLNTLKDEGINFININQQSVQVRAVDKYRIGCNAEIKEWLRVKECVDYIGCEIGTGENKINCASMLYKLVNTATLEASINRDIIITKYALKILHEVWGIPGITHSLLQGMYIFVKQHIVVNEDITVDQMIEKLKQGPSYDIYVTKSNMMKKSNGGRGRVYSYLAYLFFTEYNNGIRKNRLPLRISI